MTEAQIHKFIFAPGFSTAATVTSVSGRGVGMDVVRTNIDQIGGTIDIKSVAGEGSSVTIKIPLTLAIVSALIVEAAGDRFAIPQLSVVELVRARANPNTASSASRTPRYCACATSLPLMHLKKLLKIDDGSSSDPENGFIVVTQVGSQTLASWSTACSTPKKSWSSRCRPSCGTSTCSPATPSGRWRDHDHRSQRHRERCSAPPARRPEEPTRTPPHAIGGEQLTSLLVFRAGSSQPKAVLLGLVTRLEEIATDKIELSNGRYMVQYREQLMPLVQMNGVTVQTQGSQPILVFADDGRSMGLVVDEIIDIVEERLHIEVAGPARAFSARP